MTSNSGNRPPPKQPIDYAKWIGVAAILGGAAQTFIGANATQAGNVARNTERIGALEAKVDGLQSLNVRMARMEAKLDLIVVPRVKMEDEDERR